MAKETTETTETTEALVTFTEKKDMCVYKAHCAVMTVYLTTLAVVTAPVSLTWHAATVVQRQLGKLPPLNNSPVAVAAARPVKWPDNMRVAS